MSLNPSRVDLLLGLASPHQSSSPVVDVSELDEEDIWGASSDARSFPDENSNNPSNVVTSPVTEAKKYDMSFVGGSSSISKEVSEADPFRFINNGRRWLSNKDPGLSMAYADSGRARGFPSPLNRASPSANGTFTVAANGNSVRTPSRLIPNREPLFSSSLSSRVLHQSAPVAVPDWSKILGPERKPFANNELVEDDVVQENDDDEERLPPHELIAREYARSQITPFSMCEGAGRTLKGRDQSRVRNAILRQTALSMAYADSGRDWPIQEDAGESTTTFTSSDATLILTDTKEDCENRILVEKPQSSVRDGKGSKMLEIFLTEVNKRGGEGYFLSKKWLLTLTEHEIEELMLALGGNGYLEIYATRTTVFYERMEEHVQVCSIYDDPSRTPEDNDLCVRDKNKSEPLDHVVASSKIEQTRLSATKHDGTRFDSDLSTLSLDNNTQLAVAQVSETSPRDSPSSLPKKREKPSTNSNEKLKSLTRAVKDRSLYNYAVSTHWLSTLNDHQREDLNSALSEAGYSEMYKTSTTTYFERIQGRIRNCPAYERDTVNTSASRNIGDDTESSGLFQGNGNSLADDQGSDVGVKGAFVVIEERPKIFARCECPPQCLTVSIFDVNFTPISQSSIGPSTSSSHGEHLTRSPSRQRVGDCFVAFPKNRKGHVIATGVDKDISMTTFTFNAAGVPSEEIVSVNVSGGTSLTCYVRSDHDNKKVNIEFSKINGAANMEGSVDPRKNALVLRSVRTNVHACIVYSESVEDFEEISLVFEEEYTRPPWRRLLNDCVSLTPSEIRPKHSEQESLTLELQGDVLRRLEADVKKFSTSAYCLSFVGPPPAIMEGDIHGNLHRNSFLELQIRYQVELSFPEPCKPLPSSEIPSEIEFVEITRVPQVFDFDCVVEMRTQSLYNQGTLSRLF